MVLHNQGSFEGSPDEQNAPDLLLHNGQIWPGGSAPVPGSGPEAILLDLDLGRESPYPTHTDPTTDRSVSMKRPAPVAA